MANEYYNAAGVPQTGAAGNSVDVRSELALITAAFDKLPPLSTNGSKLVQINAGGTALTTMPFSIGVWTPAFTFATPGNLAVTYSLQIGQYVRVGPLVLLSWRVTTSTFTYTTSAGDLILNGQPFTTYGTDASYATGPSYGNYTKVGYGQIMAVMNLGTGIRFGATGTGVATATIVTGDVPSATNLTWWGSIIYRTPDA